MGYYEYFLGYYLINFADLAKDTSAKPAAGELRFIRRLH